MKWKNSKILTKIQDGYLTEVYNETMWMYRYTKRYWKSVIFYIVAGVSSTIMGLGNSVLSKYLIDAVTGGNRSHIPYLALTMVLFAAAGIILNALLSRVSARISVEVQNELQLDVFQRIIYSDWEALQNFRSGDLLNRLNSDASQVASSVISWIPNTITRLVQFIGAFAVIFYYDPIMAGIALLSAPVMVVLSRRLMHRMRTYNQEMRQLSSSLMSFQEDSFQNIQSVKAFGLMDFFSTGLGKLQQDYREKMMDYNRFSVYISSFLSAVGTCVSYICFGWSVYRLWTGYITAGTLLMFLQMANSLSSSFSSLVQMVPSAINAATCAGRLMAVADLEKEEISESPELLRIKKQRERGITVELKNIDAGYSGGRQVVNGGNFRAEPGQVTVIIGPSGEGKTTLIRLLLGLLYPKNGTAEILGADGTACRISAASRELTGYVPQGNTIFAGTIADNLRMVRLEATDDEIRDALKAACALDFVEKLPDGIYTKTGERGGGFSEGQAQRLSIARALLRDAPVLILDEATSALDTETEARVLENIMSRSKNRTCIVTTHRPSVLAMSDHVYEIRGGRLECLK